MKGELEAGLYALALLLGHRNESRPAERLGAALASVLSVLCSGLVR